MTYDYKRNGMATLLAASNAANGEISGLVRNDTAIRSGSGFAPA
jgi:hypothetical protein